MEQGDIQVESRWDQSSISHLVTQQGFRYEFRVAGNPYKKRQRNSCESGELKVLVHSRGSGNGARNRCPNCLVRIRGPQQAGAGLQFPSGVNIVLEFRADGERKLILHDRDLVLQKNTVDVVRLMMWKEIHGGYCLDQIAGTPSSAHTPDEVLPRQERHVMNEIDIKR